MHKTEPTAVCRWVQKINFWCVFGLIVVSQLRLKNILSSLMMLFEILYLEIRRTV